MCSVIRLRSYCRRSVDRYCCGFIVFAEHTRTSRERGLKRKPTDYCLASWSHRRGSGVSCPVGYLTIPYLRLVERLFCQTRLRACGGTCGFVENVYAARKLKRSSCQCDVMSVKRRAVVELTCRRTFVRSQFCLLSVSFQGQRNIQHLLYE